MNTNTIRLQYNILQIFLEIRTTVKTSKALKIEVNKLTFTVSFI